MNVFQRLLNECGERRQLTGNPADELDSLLCNFYITAKKKDDTEYEPDTMSSFSRSIQRYLDDNNAKINILKDKLFKVSREVLKYKRRELRKQRKGGRPNATEALSNEDIELIFNENQFTISMILMSFHARCGFCLLSTSAIEPAGHDARQMKFGEIVLRKDEASGEEFSEWKTERESKTRHGDENEHRRKLDDQIWFLNNPMGKNKIGRFLSSATKNLPLSTGGKLTNHSESEKLLQNAS